MGLLNKLWKQWHQPAQGEPEHEALVVSNEAFHYVPHFINGERLLVESHRYFEVVNPNTGVSERRVNVAEEVTVEKAIQAAKEGLLLWSASSQLERLRVIEQFKNAFTLQRSALIEILKQEGGLNDAMVEVEIELTVEAIMYAMTAGQLQGSMAPNWGNLNIWMQHITSPIGVVVIALNEQQTIISLISEVVVALLSGNSVIMKPHTGQPVLTVLLGDWLAQAGLPNGAYNVVQGDESVTSFLHQHPDVHAISYVFLEPSHPMAHLRQRQTTMACNFIVIDQDMDIDKVWSQFLVGPNTRLSMPFWIVIGEHADELLSKWQQHLKGQSTVVLPSEATRQKCSDLLQQAVLCGADLLVDGSQAQAPEEGWHMGRSLLANVTPEMQLHQLPPNPLAVMVMRMPDLNSVVDLINQTQNVGGVNLFTESMSSMTHFKQSLRQAEVISFNHVAVVPSVNLPRGDINYTWAIGGQHAARWHFYTRQQLVMGDAI